MSDVRVQNVFLSSYTDLCVKLIELGDGVCMSNVRRQK